MIDIRAELRQLRLSAEQWLLLASAGATIVGLSMSPPGAAVALVTGQTAIVASLALRSLHERRGWRGAQLLVALSWFMLFTVPCWLYAIDPGLLDRGDVARATLIANIALYGYALGLFVLGSTGPPSADLVIARPAQPRTRILLLWWLLGFASLSALLLRHGNPLEYLSNLDQSASLNLGAFYLVALAFMMRYAVLAWAAGHWSRGEPLPRYVIALVIAGTVLIALTGARLFVAIALADFLLLYVLLRRPLALRRVAPYVVVAGILIIFGAGTLKRYQGYQSVHPDEPIGFVDYAVNIASGEFATAYANNYVDTVRLIAIADELVPRQAGYEYARPLLEFAVKPLPHVIRPTLERQDVLQKEFSPNLEYAYAMPLVGTAFLSGGILAVILVSLAIGAVVAVLERRLAMDGASLVGVTVAVVAAVSVPGVMRSGVPAGLTFFVLDVIGMWVVARTGLRRE